MTPPPMRRYDFVPTASIIAFVFIGVFMLIGLIARCLALNQSTIHGAQSLDLMIYKIPPRANPPQQKFRPATDLQYDSTDNRDQRVSFEDPVTPVRIQRGPKNL
jgi:hypothetical protein